MFLRARRNLFPLIKSVPRSRHRAATPSAHLAASTCDKYALCLHGGDSFTNLLGLERTYPIRGEMTSGREAYRAYSVYSRRTFGRSVAAFFFDESLSPRTIKIRGGKIQRTSRFPKHAYRSGSEHMRASETEEQRSSLPLVSAFLTRFLSAGIPDDRSLNFAYVLVGLIDLSTSTGRIATRLACSSPFIYPDITTSHKSPLVRNIDSRTSVDDSMSLDD
jgi:hypothetical protein